MLKPGLLCRSELTMRRMARGLQEYHIGRTLADTRWDSEQFDVKAHIDSSLHLGENLTNIRQGLGISTRNRGSNLEDLFIKNQALLKCS